jgi:ribA/ribD-fused uncharacterized protein
MTCHVQLNTVPLYANNNNKKHTHFFLIQTEMAEKILFYSTVGTYGAFSNFSRHAVCIAGVKYPTSEHYFQAMKFVGTSDTAVRAVIAASTAAKAAALGRDRSNPLRRDWDAVKDQVMVDALMAKFSQHRVLTELLRGTGTKTLVEHTTRDRYWGDGGDGGSGAVGRNMLGQSLMQVRSALAAMDLGEVAALGHKLAGGAAATAPADTGASTSAPSTSTGDSTRRRARSP